MVWENKQIGNIVHVVPQNDLRKHCTGMVTDCWCNPNLEVTGTGTGTVVTHQSLDGREDFETGKRKPS